MKESASPAEELDPTQARLERGRYLVENVAACFSCHSEVDWASPEVQPLPGKKGGGAIFQEENLPGLIVAPNISPDRETGAGTWTDEQFARAIREGIGHDGRRLFPVMPYMNFRNMSDDDLAAVIAYVRSIDPVHNKLPKTELPEPVRQSLPPHQPITQPVPPPDFSQPVKRGEYLVHLADCHTCHTPTDPQGQFLPGLSFAGGAVFKGPWGEIASSNITPDPSGISYYDEEFYLQVIRTGSVKARKLNPLMLTGYYRRMTDDDIKSIFAYLRTVKPVQHRVDNTEPPMPCKLCGLTHGLGDHQP